MPAAPNLVVYIVEEPIGIVNSMGARLLYCEEKLSGQQKRRSFPFAKRKKIKKRWKFAL